ncbi:GNAT family N-acetyltransferase [Streptomyces luteoverticillatus]|uniref:GNAT family N-acetyltransferase n=1 Tax=Streptomyces luteoverticillatus TaxID=66425 RepID=A0A3S9PPV6_STRLT|nr:GNAT family N-acetyltransferase [Streptomyces luteoverticillatus]AZQ74364.1 GNAT family N-acetyltransferase [Streptomyces luteoverticillatus]
MSPAPTTKTVTYLKMTNPGQLAPAPAVPGLALRRLDAASPLIRSVQAEVGAAYGWRASTRTPQQWDEHLASRPLRQHWLITLNDEPAGVAYLEPHPGGDVEITAFGLLPAHLGKGLGGYALTLALQQAWATPSPGAARVSRVWLRTNTNDHPHALGNYQKRGLRPYRTETSS